MTGEGRYVAAVILDRWGFMRQGPWTAETLNGGRPIFFLKQIDDRVAYLLRATKRPADAPTVNSSGDCATGTTTGTQSHGTVPWPDSSEGKPS